MRIKKKYNNEYLRSSSGIWVRNLLKRTRYVDINRLTQGSDYQLVLENELKNRDQRNITHIDRLDEIHPDCIIVSDGYKFLERQALLKQFPSREVMVLGVNGTLAKWDLSHRRNMGFYIVNNPYPECMGYLPSKHKYYPRCIASTRAYPRFLTEYMGYLATYVPVPQVNYQTPSRASQYKIDDYRNPICAAISLAYQFGVQRLLLYCCDDSFEDYRPASVQLENGLWQYPQQAISHSVIDAHLYWLRQDKDREIRIGNYSSGPKYSNAEYISSEEDVLNFFTEEDNGVF
jgi:hypothetical protein